MTTQDETVTDGRTALVLVTLLDHLRQADVQLLHALDIARGVDGELDSATAVVIPRAEVEDLLRTCTSLHAATTNAVELAAGVPAAEIELRSQLLSAAAEGELAAGPENAQRAELLASCLPRQARLPRALEALRCTECHLNWGSTTLGDVLGRFRESDAYFVGRVTERAKLSPNTLLGRTATGHRSQNSPPFSPSTLRPSAAEAPHDDGRRCHRP